MDKFERLITKAYLSMPSPKLPQHSMEAETDYLAGYASAALRGKYFDTTFDIFSKEQKDSINRLITAHNDTSEGKDLLTYYLLVKAACNILNKYRNLDTMDNKE